MLRTNKSTNITGQSIIVDANGVEQNVVYMTASISEGSTAPNVSKVIQNTELYIANKKQCRLDMYEFDDKVDALITDDENTTVESEVTPDEN